MPHRTTDPYPARMLHGHGGNLARYQGETNCALLDFSSNANPYGPPPGFEEHLANRIHLVTELPEPDAASLRTALGHRHRSSSAQVAVGAGTTEFIHSLPRIFSAEKVCIPGHVAYADYADSARAVGAQIVESPGANLAFLANPVNPTGQLRTRDEILQMAQELQVDLFVVDESYLDLAAGGPAQSLADAPLPEGIAVLRSFSKSYGMPGLRLGYLLASEDIIKRIHAFKEPWTVSSLALTGGHFLLDPTIDHWVETTAAHLLQETSWLQTHIDEHPGLSPQVTDCHFFTVQITAPRMDAASLTSALAANGILVRDCTNFGGLGKNHVRIATRTRQENEALLGALDKIRVAGSLTH